VGFNDYFQKPIKKDKLELLINKYKKKNNQEGGRDDATTTNQGGNMVDSGGSSSNNNSAGGMMNNNGPTLRRTTSSAGIVRTTSGTSVRELIRRHRSKQSMENMINLLAQGDSEIANMILSRTNSTSSVTNHDLVRPPPRRSTLDNNSSSNNNNTNSNNNSSSQRLTLDTTMPLSILIVEDTDVCAKFLMMQLERMNCSTQRAENGQVAVDILRKALPGTFDLVLMDLRMPVMDGLDATRIIKSKLQLKELPVVALTGEMIEGCRAECAGIGFDDFFQKPMKKDKLETLINKYKSIRDGRTGGGHHHTEETTTNNCQAMNNGGGTTRAGVLRSSRRSLNALNSSLFVPDSHRQNANFDDFLQMTALRQSTTIAGKSNGGGQLHLAGRHRQLSIDQQLQDPNLKMFTKTIYSIGRSTSRESFQASISNQQLGSTNSVVNQSAVNATWESSQPIREASYVSSSTQDSALTNMPRNITLQRIKENDKNLTQQTNGSDNALWGEDVSSTCHQLKHQPDLTSIMSKMVTSTGLGGNNMRVASVQDFRNTLTTQSGSAGSGRTGHSSN
jgi:CheY-like chemotaxis protein